MSFVHIVTSMLVNDSFFSSFFRVNNTNTSVRLFIFYLLTTVSHRLFIFYLLTTALYSLYIYIYRQGPFLSFSQEPHTTLILPWCETL